MKIIVFFIIFCCNNKIFSSDYRCINFAVGKKPNITLSVNKKLSVIICGNIEKKISENKFIMNEFEIDYYFEKIGKQLYIASVLDDYIITIEYKNKNLFLDKSIYINSKEYPFLHSELQCTETECKISESICVLNLKKVQASSSLELVKKEKDFLKKMKQKPDFIWKIFDAAMIGDKRSQEFIEKTNFNAWQGHEGEGIASAQGLYILAKRKCKL